MSNQICKELDLFRDTGDSELYYSICSRFEPLIIKYSRLLGYSEAKDDLWECFVMTLITIIKKDLQRNNDPVIVTYIKTAIHNDTYT